MVNNNNNSINIRQIADRLLRHPLMLDLTLESIVQHTVDFIGIMGLSSLYYDKEAEVHITNYRAKLPCDLIAVKQVKNKRGFSLRASTNSFHSIDNSTSSKVEDTFKTQNNIIYTSFKDGDIYVAYKAIHVDGEGYPLLPDNPVFLKALELYIKKEWFTILFESGKIQYGVLQRIEQDYAWRVGQLNSEFTIPSLSEMEAISNSLNQLIPRTNEFKDGFRSLGNKEYFKDQR